MRSTRLALAATLLLAATAAPLATATAQKKGAPEPKRPKLETGADTNAAQSYYSYAMDQLSTDPDAAADGFYWASRLNPMMAEAYYGRRVALLMTQPRRLARYWSDDPSTLKDPEIRSIDSLFLKALTINPFLSQRLDGQLWRTIRKDLVEEITREYGVSGPDVEYQLNTQIKDWSPGARAWLAYTEGNFDDARMYYAKAIDKAKDAGKAYYHNERARLFAQLDMSDSALIDLNAAIAEMRKEDAKDFVYVYESKALTEQGIGMLEARVGKVADARDAFSKALEEDLAYYPAHVQLAFLAMDQHDTTTALNEMDLAVQIRGDDPGLRYDYGYALAQSGKYDEAVTQLTKASELDPVFALPQIALGVAYRGLGKAPEALAAYEKFLALAPQNDPQRDDIATMVKELKDVVQSGDPKP